MLNLFSSIKYNIINIYSSKSINSVSINILMVNFLARYFWRIRQINKINIIICTFLYIIESITHFQVYLKMLYIDLSSYLFKKKKIVELINLKIPPKIRNVPGSCNYRCFCIVITKTELGKWPLYTIQIKYDSKYRFWSPKCYPCLMFSEI